MIRSIPSKSIPLQKMNPHTAKTKVGKTFTFPSTALSFPDRAVEVRVRIYKLRSTGAMLFVDDKGTDLKASKARGELARASKIIYSESMPILYSLKTLVYHGASIGPVSISLIPQYQKYVTRLVRRPTKPYHSLFET